MSPIRFPYRCRALAAGLIAALLGGCQTAPSAADDGTPPLRNAPPACAANFATRTPLLTLPRTEAPSDLSDSKSAPLQFANDLKIDKSLLRAAQVTRYDNGWSSIGLRLRSDGARSLSVHLSEVVLPPGAEIWLCAPDGRTQQGPYREAVGGDLWTPVVPGEEAWLDVLVETRRQDAFKARIADAYGGFR